MRRGIPRLPLAAWKRAYPRDRQARMDQRERADKIEPTLAAEPIENADASDRSSLGADREARAASRHAHR